MTDTLAIRVLGDFQVAAAGGVLELPPSRKTRALLAFLAVSGRAQQRERLATALQGIYRKPVLLQQVLDPQVVGGIRVQVGDEVVDGTVVRRLDDVRRRITG